MSNPTQRSRQAIEALGEHTPQEAAGVYATLAVYEQLALLTNQLRELNRSIDNGLTIFANPTELTTTTADESASITAPTNRCGWDSEAVPGARCIELAGHEGIHVFEIGSAE